MLKPQGQSDVYPLPCGWKAAVTVQELMVLPTVRPGTSSLVPALASTDCIFLAGLGQALEEDAGTCISPSDTGINECVFFK